MQLKQYERYVIDFKGKWIRKCAAIMGVSLFIRVVYFFGLMNFSECGVMQIIFDMVLCMGLSVAFLVFIAALRQNAPGLYALMGCGFILLMMITTFSSGNALRIILAILAYSGAAVVLLGTVGGYVPGKMLATLTLLLPTIIRFLAYDLGKLGLFTWVLEISRLLVVISLLCFVWTLKPIKKT